MALDIENAKIQANSADEALIRGEFGGALHGAIFLDLITVT